MEPNQADIRFPVIRVGPLQGVLVGPTQAVLATPFRGSCAARTRASLRSRTSASTCPGRSSAAPPGTCRAHRSGEGDGLESAVEGPGRVRAPYEVTPDLAVRLPSAEFAVLIRELDHRGCPGQAFITQTGYYTRDQRTTANKNFLPSGLEATVIKAWQDQTVLAQRDTSGATLEEQLPALIRMLETSEAEAQWARKRTNAATPSARPAGKRSRREAFTKVAYERNAQRLGDELARRDAAAAMTAYADEITARADLLDAPGAAAAREWATWIRRHAERTNPLNGPLQVLAVTSCSHQELEPHMNDWSIYGPHRR